MNEHQKTDHNTGVKPWPIIPLFQLSYRDFAEQYENRQRFQNCYAKQIAADDEWKKRTSV